MYNNNTLSFFIQTLLNNSSLSEPNLHIFYPRLICSIISGIALITLIIIFIVMLIKSKVIKQNYLDSSMILLRNDKSKVILVSHWIIFFIATSELIGCIGIYIHIPSQKDQNAPSTLCQLQGCFLIFCEVTTICFTSILSYWILLLALGKIQMDSFNTLKLPWIIYGYLPGSVLAIVPFLIKTENRSSYGLNGHWCWIFKKNDIIFNEMLPSNIFTIIVYCFSWGNLLFTIIAVTISLMKYKDLANKLRERNVDTYLKVLAFCDFIFYFPLIIIICWILPTANRILTEVYNRDNIMLYIGHGVSLSLLGFVNSIVFLVYQFCKKEQNNDIRSVNIIRSVAEGDVDLFHDDDSESNLKGE